MGDVRGGSPDAFQHLMDRLWVELVRFAAWELADLDAAKDVVQGAFVHVWEHRRSWIDGGSPRAYLYRIVRHRITDHQRHARVRARWVEREEDRPHAGPPTPTDDLATAEVQRAFDQALSDLSPRRREVFSLVALRDLSHREVAEIMGISEQTVANQVSSALQAIRKAMREVSDSVS
jgi:RNA polymerase sigma-70 factor (ECF subfamily)